MREGVPKLQPQKEARDKKTRALAGELLNKERQEIARAFTHSKLMEGEARMTPEEVKKHRETEERKKAYLKHKQEK